MNKSTAKSGNSKKESPKPFAALDRDGTIIIDKHYLSDYRQVELLPNAAKGLYKMQEMGLGIVVITNQSGIGRGYFSIGKLNLIHERMEKLLLDEGVGIDGIFYCPHTPDTCCECRKPKIFLLQKASSTLNFPLEQSFVIGDKSCDIELGKNVGAKTVLVRTGSGKKFDFDRGVTPDYVVDDLFEAAYKIKDKLYK